MPRTRKYLGRRRKATRRHRRHGEMKGGGKLDRLPVGPGSRNAAGNPILIEITDSLIFETVFLSNHSIAKYFALKIGCIYILCPVINNITIVF